MKTCQVCGRQFSIFRIHCPHCKNVQVVETSKRNADDGVDVAGFAVGYATGIPLSPTQGLSNAAMLGAALHSSEHHETPAPTESHHVVPDSSPSYDSSSSSSSSSSFDSGGSSGGGGGGD